MSQATPSNKPVRKPKKPCAEVGCSNLTRETYCKKHEENNKNTARDYNRYQRDPVINAFYRSSDWIKVRRLALERDKYLCRRCMKQGQLVPANVVHHLVEVKVDWMKRLDIDNLESLCHGCHNSDHKSGNKNGPRG